MHSLQNMACTRIFYPKIMYAVTHGEALSVKTLCCSTKTSFFPHSLVFKLHHYNASLQVPTSAEIFPARLVPVEDTASKIFGTYGTNCIRQYRRAVTNYLVISLLLTVWFAVSAPACNPICSTICTHRGFIILSTCMHFAIASFPGC